MLEDLCSAHYERERHFKIPIIWDYKTRDILFAKETGIYVIDNMRATVKSWEWASGARGLFMGTYNTHTYTYMYMYSVHASAWYSTHSIMNILMCAHSAKVKFSQLLDSDSKQ